MKPEQAIFNTVVKHLLTQNKKSMDSTGGAMRREICAYRGEGGLKCAVGCLIPDELYTPNMEGVDALWIATDHPELKVVPAFDEAYRALLGDLQTVHDCNPPELWPRVLSELAVEYELTLPTELENA